MVQSREVGGWGSPLGMALEASFRSPDMLAPAMMPVTAGKKTANTVKKPAMGGGQGGSVRERVCVGLRVTCQTCHAVCQCQGQC